MNNEQLREKIEKDLTHLFKAYVCIDFSCGDSPEQHAKEFAPYIMTSIAAHHAKEIDELAKAFGGCKKCYGKGYSTVLEHVSGGHGGSEIFEQLPRMHFCSCERGESLKSEITLLTTYEK